MWHAAGYYRALLQSQQEAAAQERSPGGSGGGGQEGAPQPGRGQRALLLSDWELAGLPSLLAFLLLCLERHPEQVPAEVEAGDPNDLLLNLGHQMQVGVGELLLLGQLLLLLGCWCC
jgi:hypothetical protein